MISKSKTNLYNKVIMQKLNFRLFRTRKKPKINKAQSKIRKCVEISKVKHIIPAANVQKCVITIFLCLQTIIKVRRLGCYTTIKPKSHTG